MNNIQNIAPKFLSVPCMVVCLLVCMVVVFTPAQINAATNPKYASIVMDAETGIILSQKYADKKLPPASLTKMMTLLVTFEAINSRKIKLNERIWVSKYAASMVPSKLDLKVGSSIKVKDAIYALVTKSANDVAVALAEHIGGSEYGFARMMNRRAKLIGMTNTNFTNASGLHDPRQVSTARDMAKLGRSLVVNYPREYKYFSTRSFTYRGKTYNNHNRLLGKYRGLDGIKTGYVSASGFNLVASAVRNNRRLIGVVFGGKSGKTRNAHMEVLLDSGFSKVGRMRFAQAPAPTRKPGVILSDSQLSVPRSPSNQSLKSAYADLNNKIDNTGSTNSKLSDPSSLRAGLNTPQNFETSGRSASYARPTLPESTLSVSRNTKPWSIQVGAFSSRASSDKALYNAAQKLPAQYAQATPVIAPLKTEQGWMFRARLSGFSKDTAYDACKYLDGCMAVAP